MSWKTKGAGDDDVCLIASGVANITHVSLPSNSLYLHIWTVYPIISKLPPHHNVMYDYLGDVSSVKSFDSILNTDCNTKSNILNTNIINI